MFILSGHENILRWAVLSTWTFSPMTHPKSEMTSHVALLLLQHLTWSWTSSVNTCLEAASLPGKVSALNIFEPMNKYRFGVSSCVSGFRFFSKQIFINININQADLEKWKPDSESRSTLCREVAENKSPPKEQKEQQRKTTIKSQHLAPGMDVFFAQKKSGCVVHLFRSSFFFLMGNMICGYLRQHIWNLKVGG